jgi:hypothetical protein
MEKLKYMKAKLVDCIEKEINGNLEYTNAQELGEAVDMVKDLSEAIYYCTITEAMEDKGNGYGYGNRHQNATHYYSDWGKSPEYYEPSYPMYYGDRSYPPMMYSDGNNSSNGGHGGARYYGNTRMPQHDPYYPQGDDRTSQYKKRYMDGKVHNDKNAQMRDLELYTQELAQDITEMIKDASPEERQLLQQKINMLASKIK